MELHILFFILAGLLIAVLIGSSIWSNRREKSRVFSNTFSTRPPATPINQGLAAGVPKTLNPQAYQEQNYIPQPDVELDSSAEIQQEVESSLRGIKIKLSDQDTSIIAQVSQAPVYGQQQPEVQTNGPFEHIAQPEPLVEPTIQLKMEEEPTLQTTEQTEIEETSNDMMQLYIVAAEGQQFAGEYTVQALEALGFQYGEYQIFHRHQHLGNNNSPVIFSVANMMNPGVFDLNKLDRFSTVGLVMFMHLPSEGNDVANLKLMIQSAERLAQSLGGFVLNDRREIFDENSRLEYLNRLR